jgi:glycosyltransferase involved in cell wall biosynthesis
VNAEAMACATPVIGSRRGGIPEVLGETGVLIDPEDIAGFADAMCLLLGNPDYSAKLGRAAHQRCLEMFDWQVVAQRWNSLLHSAAAKLFDARCKKLAGPSSDSGNCGTV